MQHMQTKTDHLALAAEKTARIGKENTKVMRANSKHRDNTKLKDVDLEDVHSFTLYLDNNLTSHEAAQEHVKSRIRKARRAFNTLRPVWNSTSISMKSKLRNFTTNVKLLLLYGYQNLESDMIHTKQAANLH